MVDKDLFSCFSRFKVIKGEDGKEKGGKKGRNDGEELCVELVCIVIFRILI